MGRDVRRGRLGRGETGTPDVIVMTDEAHRSQYDTLALNMRAALPKSRAEHTTCCCRA